MTDASLIKIDATTRLVKINPQSTGVPEEKNEAEKKLVVVQDISGSMGQSVRRCIRAIGKMAEENGYNNVNLITFGTTAEHTIVPVCDMKVSMMGCNGMTNMAPTVAYVRDFINSMNNTLIQLLIISDGAISDKHHFQNIIHRLPEELTQNNNVVHVVGCRLSTGYGSADTSALSGYFNIHNFPGIVPSVLEWPDYTQISSYINTVRNIFARNATISGYKLGCDQPVLRLKPWERLKNEVILRNSDNIVLIEGTNQIPELMINNHRLILQPEELESEDHLANFINEIDFKMRNWKVMGGQDTSIQSTIEFIKKMQAYFERMSIAKMPDPSTVNCNLRARTKVLFAEAQRREKSRLQSILEMGNMQKVDLLNSDNQAAFLRQVSNSAKSARRVAKRTVVSGDEISKSIVNGLRILRDTNIDLPEDGVMPSSYYGLYEDPEVLEIIKESYDQLSVLSNEAILQIVGQVGVCYRANIGNVPDPWQYEVLEVYPRVFLSQNDLWQSHTQSNGESLHPPGMHHKDITGVDVLMTPGTEQVYNLFRRTIFPKIQASISMRRLIAPIPYDTVALKTAVTMRLVLQVFENPREGNIETLQRQIMTLRHLDQSLSNLFGELPNNIVRVGPNVGAYLTGRQDISSINKVCCFLFARSNQLSPEFDFANLARVMYSLDSYHFIRKKKPDNREEIIDSVLDIDLAAHQTDIGDDFEDPPNPDNHYSEFDVTSVNNNVAKYISDPTLIDVITRFAQVLQTVSIEELTPQTIIDARSLTTFGVDAEAFELFKATNAIQALQSASLSDRVDVDAMEMKLPEIMSAEQQHEFLRQIVRNRFKRDFDGRMKVKAAREKEILFQRAVARMIETEDINEFIELLKNYVPTRDVPGYTLFRQKLMTVQNVTLIKEKIWVVATGRRMGTDDIVWNNGNAVRVGFHDAKKFYSDSEWMMLVKVTRSNNFHIYRLSNKQNRHGNNNSNPSWFALGYSGKDEMLRDLNLSSVLAAYQAAVTRAISR